MAKVDNQLHQGSGNLPDGAGNTAPMKRMESVLPAPIGAGDVGTVVFPSLAGAEGGNSDRNDDEGSHPFGKVYPYGPQAQGENINNQGRA